MPDLPPTPAPTAPDSLRPAARLVPNRRASFVQSALIVLAGLAVFAPAFHGDWLWDDNSEITGQPDRCIAVPARWERSGAIRRAPDSTSRSKAAALWVQWHLWHETICFGYHLVSVGLHLFSAFLIWHVLKKLGVRLAWVGGLLFVVHLLAVESVAWVAELKNTLSLPPLLLAVCAWLDYDERGRRTDYLRAASARPPAATSWASTTA